MSTVLNRASVKRYALAVSAARRANKFTRVGEDFLLRVESMVEVGIRRIVIGEIESLAPEEGATFITATARAKAHEKLEQMARNTIFNEVIRHPSVGVTLK